LVHQLLFLGAGCSISFSASTNMPAISGVLGTLTLVLLQLTEQKQIEEK